MSDHTHIEWTDATWNPITGCSVVSGGCKHCYAMKLAGTRLAHHPSRAGLTVDTKAGPVWNGQVRLNEEWLDQPLRWRRSRRIFVCAHGDLFHEAVPEEWIDRVFTVMACAPKHTFQVLTKRPARMQAYLERFKDSGARDGFVTRGGVRHGDVGAGPIFFPERWPLPNVWLGVSVEDQAAADERIPLLLQCPAAVRWISAEPLLGPVDLTVDGLACEDCSHCERAIMDPTTGAYECSHCDSTGKTNELAIDWVVAGGESGAGARPMHPDWARSLRDQCAAAGVPFLFKQWGEWSPWSAYPPGPPEGARTATYWPDGGFGGGHVGSRGGPGHHMVREGKKRAGRLLDGELHDAYPRAAA